MPAGLAATVTGPSAADSRLEPWLHRTRRRPFRRLHRREEELGRPVRVLCLGDSLVQGFAVDGDDLFRAHLYRELVLTRRLNVDFVGRRNSVDEGTGVAWRRGDAADFDHDHDHEGWGGSGIGMWNSEMPQHCGI